MPFTKVAYYQDDGEKRTIFLNTDNISEFDERSLVRMTNGREYRLTAASHVRLMGLLESRREIDSRHWNAF